MKGFEGLGPRRSTWLVRAGRIGAVEEKGQAPKLDKIDQAPKSDCSGWFVFSGEWRDMNRVILGYQNVLLGIQTLAMG